MDYFSILPRDISNLLLYYTNYENFKVAAEIYERCMIIWEDIDLEGHNTRRLLLDSYMRNELGLRFTHERIQFADTYDGPHKCLLAILDPSQLVTLDSLTHLLRELCKKRYSDYLYGGFTWRINEIRSILCKHNGPLRIIKIDLHPDNAFDMSSYIVVNINDFSSTNFMNDLAKGLLY